MVFTQGRGKQRRSLRPLPPLRKTWLNKLRHLRRMCGILAVLYSSVNRYSEPKLKKAVSHLVARGPEGTSIKHFDEATLAFTRLAINGLHEGGMQPFEKSYATWICNGEIYNAKALEKTLDYTSQGSDCEVLGFLYSTVKDPMAFCRVLDGVFCIVLYDPDSDSYIVARDPYGIRPLYWSDDKFFGLSFASERKVLEEMIEPYAKVLEFPPGEVWTIKAGICVKKDIYHTVPWLKASHMTEGVARTTVHDSLVAAVEKRLLTERPVAALLSGGLDSSLIAALVQKRLKEMGKPALKTFSIGMVGSSDLAHARLVAEWIGSDHHEIVVTADEMFACIPEVIRDIESYDITTVRASVGNWMVAREVRRRSECKVVFNGDGSDEEWGSYLYFYKAPNDFAFEADSQRLLAEIHRYDVLRSDRSISSHGLEARTPFLDKQFVAVAMSIPTEFRRPGRGSVTGTGHERPEKKLLRDAFNTGLLPDAVLWRKKEAFSDGVSTQEKSWFQEIQERVLGQGIPEGWEALAEKFEPRPKTPEAFYYRSLYEERFKKTGDYWPFWMPRWSPETSDPSARTLSLAP